MRTTAAAVDVAGACASSQSGLPPPVRYPAKSYMSLTAALRPASEPAPAPLRGAVKSCGTKAESDRATDMPPPNSYPWEPPARISGLAKCSSCLTDPRQVDILGAFLVMRIECNLIQPKRPASARFRRR